MLHFPLSSLVSMLLLLSAGSLAHAASFTVNTEADLPDAVPGDGFCAAAPTGECSVRAAVMETNALAGADEVTLPAGTFTLTIDGTDELGLLGDLDIVSSEVTFRGAGAGATVLDGGGIDRYFEISNSTVVIEDLTIQNGAADANSAVGGAIAVGGGVDFPSLVHLTRVRLLNNRAQGGGALRAISSTTLRVVDSHFEGNQTSELGTSNRRGAAIYCQGCTITLDGCTLTGNGDDLSGKIIHVEGNGHLALLNSTVSGNPFGGGIRAENANVSLRFSTLVDNGAQNLSFFSFDDTHAFEVGSSVLQNATHDNCQAGDLPTSLGYNVVGDASCAFTAAGDLQDTDALLSDLEDHGGPTATHLPATDSPAIDRVPPGECTDLDELPLTRDQRDSVRPQGANCDSGAVELANPLIFENGFETPAP